MGYIDPGMFGMISQIGYMLLFAVVSSFMFLFQPIKNFMSRWRAQDQSSHAPLRADETTSLKNPGA